MRHRRLEVQRTTYRRERGDAPGGAYVVEVDRDTEWWLQCELCPHRERFYDMWVAIDACDQHALGHIAEGRK